MIKGGGMQYICSAGETFDSVSLCVYGNEKYACDIMNENPALCTRAVFTGGERLLLPAVDVPDENGDTSYPLSSAPWR